MKKIAFFDVDGTLCNSSGKVLPSTKDAIRNFRKEGNLAYICTGRSKPEILESILEVGFDGVIGAGGGYIVINDEVVSHMRMPEKTVKEIIAFFDEQDIGYYLETNDGLFGSENLVRKIEEELRKKCLENGLVFEEENEKVKWFFDLMYQMDDIKVDYSNVNKISFINNTIAFSEVDEKFGNECQMHHTTVAVFGSESGEISVKGVDKKRAIEFVLNQLALEKKDAIAFGDGDNDIAMFEAVGYGVAMENATDKLKALAHEVTSNANQDGIALSFEKKKWLS